MTKNDKALTALAIYRMHHKENIETINHGYPNRSVPTHPFQAHQLNPRKRTPSLTKIRQVKNQAGFRSQHNLMSFHFTPNGSTKFDDLMNRMRGDRKEIIAKQQIKKHTLNQMWKMYGSIIEMDREKFQLSYQYSNDPVAKQKRLLEELGSRNVANLTAIVEYRNQKKVKDSSKVKHCQRIPETIKQVKPIAQELIKNNSGNSKSQGTIDPKKGSSKKLELKTTQTRAVSKKPNADSIDSRHFRQSSNLKGSQLHKNQRPNRTLSRTSILKSVVIDSQLADQVQILEKKRFMEKGRFMKAFNQKKKDKLTIKPKGSTSIVDMYIIPIHDF